MVPWEGGPGNNISPTELARAQIYGLLARLFSRPPTAAELRDIANLTGGSSPIGAALSAVGESARTGNADAIADEFNTLFVGLTEGELRPYASYYLTGFLYEKPLADLRWDMAQLGFARNDGNAEPEDHIACVLEIMEGLIIGAVGAPATLDEQQRFFDAHIVPWAEAFFLDLEAAETADFYRPVGALGRLFIAIERDAFSVAGEEASTA